MSNAATEHPSIAIATEILDHINDLRNSEVSKASAGEITGLIHDLANDCNTKFLRDISIRVVYKPNSGLQLNVKTFYDSDQYVTIIQKLIIKILQKLENNSFRTQKEASKRCIDVMKILIDYSNEAVLCRTEYKLELQEKRLDGFEQSSNPVETSNLVIGDDFYG